MLYNKRLIINNTNITKKIEYLAIIVENLTITKSNCNRTLKEKQ